MCGAVNVQFYFGNFSLAFIFVIVVFVEVEGQISLVPARDKNPAVKRVPAEPNSNRRERRSLSNIGSFVYTSFVYVAPAHYAFPNPIPIG